METVPAARSNDFRGGREKGRNFPARFPARRFRDLRFRNWNVLKSASTGLGSYCR